MQELSSNRLVKIRRLHKERIETLNKLATFQVYSITQHIVWLKVRPCNVEFYMTFLPLFLVASRIYWQISKASVLPKLFSLLMTNFRSLKQSWMITNHC